MGKDDLMSLEIARRKAQLEGDVTKLRKINKKIDVLKETVIEVQPAASDVDKMAAYDPSKHGTVEQYEKMKHAHSKKLALAMESGKVAPEFGDKAAQSHILEKDPETRCQELQRVIRRNQGRFAICMSFTGVLVVATIFAFGSDHTTVAGARNKSIGMSIFGLYGLALTLGVVLGFFWIVVKCCMTDDHLCFKHVRCGGCCAGPMGILSGGRRFA
jgi:hypothetical protein